MASTTVWPCPTSTPLARTTLTALTPKGAPRAEGAADDDANATLAVLQHVLRGIGEDDLSASTPCAEYTVGQLEAHLLGSLSSLTSLAGSTLMLTTAESIESRIADAAQRAVETWTERGLEGTAQAGPQALPAPIRAGILSVDFLVHPWDFASATGQKVAVSDEVATYVLGLAEQAVTPELRKQAGFDPATPINQASPALDRLVAFTGRTA